MRQGNRGSQASAADTADTTPAAVAEYRQRLSRGESVVDPETWAGSVPAAQGIAPRVRVGRSRWFVAHFSEVGGGYGGYNPDHEFFGYRQSI